VQDSQQSSFKFHHERPTKFLSQILIPIMQNLHYYAKSTGKPKLRNILQHDDSPERGYFRNAGGTSATSTMTRTYTYHDRTNDEYKRRISPVFRRECAATNIISHYRYWGLPTYINEVSDDSKPHRASRHTKSNSQNIPRHSCALRSNAIGLVDVPRSIPPVLLYEGCSRVRRQLAGVL
jgi:hypothetical protein